MGLGLAAKTFFRVLTDRTFAERIEQLEKGIPAPAPAAKPRPEDCLRLLAILQRDGRLVDFLTEDVSGYGDAEVGAAVRDIHRDCRAALEKYLDLGPVLDKQEGERVEIGAGFHPAEIRLTGNVVGSPPFRGELVHRGWRVRTLRLPDPPEGADPMLLAPAEVELP